MNNEQLITAYHEACHAIFVLINEKNKFIFQEIKNNRTSYDVPYANKTKIALAEFEIGAKISLAGEIGTFLFFDNELKMIVQKEAGALTDFKKILKLYQFVKNDFDYEIRAEHIAYLQTFVSNIIQTLYYYREEIRLLVQIYLQNNNCVTREDAFYIMKNKTLPMCFKRKQKQLWNCHNLLTEEQLTKDILNSSLFNIAEIFKMEIDEINNKLQCKENSKEVHKKLIKIVLINHDVKIMKEFLQVNNDDCNITNKNGDSLLMLAIESEADDIAIALLQYDVDINMQNSEGETALHWASLAGHNAIVALLLERVEIDVNLQNKDGEMALHFAALCDNNSLTMAFLLEHCKININAQTKTGTTALHFAAFNNYINIVDLLLSYKTINVNQYSHSGNTALHWAVLNGHVAIVKRLLNHKTIVTNIANSNKEIPLLVAALNGHSEITKLLLQHDENISHSNENIINFFVMIKQYKYVIKPDIVNLIDEKFKKFNNASSSVTMPFTKDESLRINKDVYAVSTRPLQVKQAPLNTEMNWALFDANHDIPQTLVSSITTAETFFWPSFVIKDNQSSVPEQINMITKQQRAKNLFFAHTRANSI